MSTTDVARESRKNGDAALVQEIALDKIAESKTNPRKRFDPEKLKELSEMSGSRASCSRSTFDG